MIYVLSIGEKLKDAISQSMDINLFELLVNLIATILLVLIVRFFFWNKVTNFLDTKKKQIEEDYKRRDDLVKETEELKNEAEVTLNNSKKEAESIITSAQATARAEENRIINEAKEKSSEIIKESEKEGTRIKNEMIKNAKDTIVDIASDIAGKIIDEEIDQDKYNKKILDDLKEEK